MSSQEDSEWCSPLFPKLNAYVVATMHVVGLQYSVFVVLSPVWGVKCHPEIPSSILVLHKEVDINKWGRSLIWLQGLLPCAPILLGIVNSAGARLPWSEDGLQG